MKDMEKLIRQYEENHTDTFYATELNQIKQIAEEEGNGDPANVLLSAIYSALRAGYSVGYNDAKNDSNPDIRDIFRMLFEMDDKSVKKTVKYLTWYIFDAVVVRMDSKKDQIVYDCETGQVDIYIVGHDVDKLVHAFEDIDRRRWLEEY